jgi:hypothetical protein
MNLKLSFERVIEACHTHIEYCLGENSFDNESSDLAQCLAQVEEFYANHFNEKSIGHIFKDFCNWDQQHGGY